MGYFKMLETFLYASIAVNDLTDWLEKSNVGSLLCIGHVYEVIATHQGCTALSCDFRNKSLMSLFVYLVI